MGLTCTLEVSDMFQVMKNNDWRSFLDGFLSAFGWFPAPARPIRVARRTPEDAMREVWSRVGGCIRVAIEEARDEARSAEGQHTRRS